MTAAEYGRPDRWPDAMDRLMEQIGLPAPGTAMMPPASCRAAGAVPVSMGSHAETLPCGSTPVIRNPSA
ncbi:hypothetical protein [Roseomonas indoligenes]|uniref:Uncharacterized protein n=1 Tax=Roseomonas indoligenes TaxID=2820811 RepID=A0A940MQF3_9PROT|nr:hypothetical protein [Pararoseomonas indoligenes]MBP0492108.1 hypothetical protein [Pararoseomonas indoligenes]